jgi:hypothetical protein
VRRAGGLQTAASVAGNALLIHNAGGRFTVQGVKVQRERLSEAQIVAAIRGVGR